MTGESTDIIGRCPICRSEMVNFGNLVVCPEGDYKAAFPAWDELWTAFNPDTDDAAKLLIDLVNLNQVDIRPVEIVARQEKALDDD